MFNQLLASFSLNLWTDLQDMWQYDFMRHAFEAGTIIALVAGVVGYFVVLRRLSFAAHALSHVGFAGAAGAVLIRVKSISWFIWLYCEWSVLVWLHLARELSNETFKLELS